MGTFGGFGIYDVTNKLNSREYIHLHIENEKYGGVGNTYKHSKKDTHSFICTKAKPPRLGNELVSAATHPLLRNLATF